jgi:hypothetical protein
MTLMQRQPRVEDPAYLAYVRTLPCLICGRGPSDPAHIRAAAPHYGKRYTGKGEKPDDKWVLPLCRRHHDAQHRESELGWWAGMGLVDPFAVAVALYASRPGADRPRIERPRRSKPVTRKPKAERKPVGKSRPIPQRKAEWPQGRPMQSRSTFEKAKP